MSRTEAAGEHRSLIAELRRDARPLPHDPTRLVIPEHAVKHALRTFGVSVPRGSVGPPGVATDPQVAELREPLVLKAYGAGIVHKSDVGAVVVGIARDDLPVATKAMLARLHDHGIVPDGFLVEELAPPGVELIVGVTRREPFGTVVVLGIGGTLVEAVDRTWARMLPLSEASADSLIDELPAVLLAGGRSTGPLDRTALRTLLLALAGPEGFCTQIEGDLLELECNPVIVGPGGAIAVDARLVLDAADRTPSTDADAPDDFAAVFAPNTVAVAGASSSRSTFGNWFLEAYRSVGWSDGLFALHPSAEDIDGVPAIRTAADVPGGIDYLLAAVPAAKVPALVAQNAPATRFVHVISGGFAESGPAGAELERDLVDAARHGGARVLGPNCMGAFSPAGRQTFMMNPPRDGGRTSVISQSGSLASDIVRGGDARGVRFARFVTVGNCADVGIGELVTWLADDDATGVIGLYVEGPRDRRLAEAIRIAAGRKAIVVLAGGQSTQGAEAAASHTGALTGDATVWQALSASYAVTVTNTIEHFLAALAYLQRYEQRPASTTSERGAIVVGPGGGASVLATDALDRAGVDVTPLRADVKDALVDAGFGAGTSAHNPVEVPIGPATPPDAFDRVLGPVLARQPFHDVVCQLSLASYYNFPGSGVDGLVRTLECLGSSSYDGVRVGVVLRSLDCAPADDLARVRSAAAQADVVVFRDFDEAAVAVAAAQRFDRVRADGEAVATASAGQGGAV